VSAHYSEYASNCLSFEFNAAARIVTEPDRALCGPVRRRDFMRNQP
jgi:hypothetical protein